VAKNTKSELDIDQRQNKACILYLFFRCLVWQTSDPLGVINLDWKNFKRRPIEAGVNDFSTACCKKIGGEV